MPQSTDLLIAAIKLCGQFKKTHSSSLSAQLKKIPALIAKCKSEKTLNEIGSKEGEKYTPLIFACKMNLETVVKELIGAGADINLGDELGVTPLVYSYCTDKRNIANMLILSGADLLKKIERTSLPVFPGLVTCNSIVTKETMLTLAAKNNDLEFLQLIISKTLPNYARVLGKISVSSNVYNILVLQLIASGFPLHEMNDLLPYLSKEMVVGITREDTKLFMKTISQFSDPVTSFMLQTYEIQPLLVQLDLLLEALDQYQKTPESTAASLLLQYEACSSAFRVLYENKYRWHLLDFKLNKFFEVLGTLVLCLVGAVADRMEKRDFSSLMKLENIINVLVSFYANANSVIDWMQVVDTMEPAKTHILKYWGSVEKRNPLLPRSIAVGFKEIIKQKEEQRLHPILSLQKISPNLRTENITDVIKKHANKVNDADENGVLPLEFAIESGLTEDINSLMAVNAKIDIESKNKKGVALIQAVANANPDLAKALLKRHYKLFNLPDSPVVCMNGKLILKLIATGLSIKDPTIIVKWLFTSNPETEVSSVCVKDVCQLINDKKITTLSAEEYSWLPPTKLIAMFYGAPIDKIISGQKTPSELITAMTSHLSHFELNWIKSYLLKNKEAKNNAGQAFQDVSAILYQLYTAGVYNYFVKPARSILDMLEEVSLDQFDVKQLNVVISNLDLVIGLAKVCLKAIDENDFQSLYKKIDALKIKVTDVRNAKQQVVQAQIKEDKKKQEAERLRLEEEKRKQEEERLTLEEERKKQESERLKQERERKRIEQEIIKQEAEKQRIEEEQRKREKRRLKLQEKKKTLQAQKMRKEEDSKRLEEAKVKERADQFGVFNTVPDEIDCYLVGGAVLPLIFEDLTVNDFDMVGKGNNEAFQRLLSNGYNRDNKLTDIHLYKRRNVFPKKEKFDLVRVFYSNDDWLKEDAMTRDFTKCAVYYHPKKGFLDPTGYGLDDIKNHVLRMVGDEQHFYADPVKMLRAIRFEATGDKPDELLVSALKNWSNKYLLDKPINKINHFFIKYDEYKSLYPDFISYLEKYDLFNKIELARAINPGTIVSRDASTLRNQNWMRFYSSPYSYSPHSASNAAIPEQNYDHGF